MIENEQQCELTRKALEKLQEGLAVLLQDGPVAGVHPRLHQAQLDGLQSQIETLTEELAAYEAGSAKKTDDVEAETGPLLVLSPEQRRALQVLEWLFSIGPGERQKGRTTVLAVVAIRNAFRYPGTRVGLADHCGESTGLHRLRAIVMALLDGNGFSPEWLVGTRDSVLFVPPVEVSARARYNAIRSSFLAL